MKDENMLKLLQSIDVGTELILTIKCIGGATKLQGIYKGALMQEGFYKPSGGWSQYEGKNDLPCWQFYFKEHKKRSLYIMQIGYKVVDIEIAS